MTTKRPWSKGPWARHKRARLTVQSGDRTVCSTGAYQDGSDATNAENQANAALITAAPELYEALDAIINAADGRGWEQLDPTLSAARAALRAANPDAFDGEGK